ncbi:MAG: metal-dependent hydrolase [Pirellulaceae bacterium]|nr:metal-dependent hydrolase [Pirellulaceae bacterium]
MAGFRTHITVSSLMGVGYGGAAYWFYDVPIPTCILAGGLCAVSGMLPDVDSDSGRPLRESIAFAAAVVPMMLVDRLVKFNVATETIVLVGAFAYLIIRFGAAALLKRLTVHRGMFHSLPAAIIFGEIAFLLASGDNVYLRYYKAGGVTLGYLSHLLLDEFYSIGMQRGQVRLKKSFGTAFKIFGHGFVPNVATYALLALFTTIAINEPGWMNAAYQRHNQRIEQFAARFNKGQTDAPAAQDAGNETSDGTILEAAKKSLADPGSWFK